TLREKLIPCFVSLCVYECVCVCVSVWVCAQIQWSYVCLCVCVCAQIQCSYVCVFAQKQWSYMCVCVCVFLCVFVYLRPSMCGCKLRLFIVIICELVCVSVSE